MGDVLRRLVARTIAEQVSKKAEVATAPFQYALSTKAGCECVAHILQTLTDVDERATIVSIDGIGAYDLRLLMMENGDRVLPFVRCFCGSPSTYMWEDEMGVSQDIPQGEGGEHPLMPMLFALGQHGALLAIQERLLEGERVFAFLDDIYVVCMPERVADVTPSSNRSCLFTRGSKCGTEEVLSRRTSTSSPQRPECGFQMQWSGEEPQSCPQQGKG